MIMHGIGDYATVAARALTAGVEMDMVSEAFNNTLKQSLNEGKVSDSDIDTACRHILEAKYKLGLFDNPYKYNDVNRSKKDIYNKENRNAARRIASQSMVLLKNDKNTLPLNKAKNIALIGPLANSAINMPGMWSFHSDFVKPVTLLEGLKNVLANSAEVTYARGSNVLEDEILETKLSYKNISERDGRSNKVLLEEALSIAKNADIIIAALGESSEMSGEGASRANIDIPEPQKQLLKELVSLGKPVVLVLFTGRPLVLTWENENVDAILNVWFAGSEAGFAIADVLTGKVNPSGKLPMSFPYHVGQIPVFYNHKNTGRPMPPNEPYVKYRSNYQDIPNEPLYPFGYGLSYSSFIYSDLTLSSKNMAREGKIEARVNITNNSSVAGSEVVQLYIRDVVASSTRPVKELKGFKKVFLKAGETKEIIFDITLEDLKFYNHDLEFVAEDGEFEVMIGGSSLTNNSAQFTLK